MLDLLSNGHNRFMVGDIKQSIYRFRQADPQIFNDKFKAYQEEGAKGRLILLKENFRSHVEVLVRNQLMSFGHLMDEEVGEIDTIKPIIWSQEATSSGWPCHNIGRIFAL